MKKGLFIPINNYNKGKMVGNVGFEPTTFTMSR